MDNIPEKKIEQQDTSQSSPLQSEAGNTLATDAKWTNTPAKELLAAMPNLEVLGAKARDNTNSVTALDKAVTDLKKGRFSEHSEHMLKSSFEFSPEALKSMVKDLNAKLKPVGEELKIHSNGTDKKTADTILLDLCKKGKTVDSIVLGGGKKDAAPPPKDAPDPHTQDKPLGAGAPSFAPRAPYEVPSRPQSLPVAPPENSDARGASRPMAQQLPLDSRRPEPAIDPFYPPGIDRRGPQDGGPAIDPVYPTEPRYDKIPTSDGPTIVASAGDTVWASRGDTVWAYMGSTVYAEAGSKVRAYNGSTVECYPGSDVHIYAGSQCKINKGTMVNFEYVGAFQNRRFPEGVNVMANQRMYHIPFGQTVYNVYGPFWIKP